MQIASEGFERPNLTQEEKQAYVDNLNAQMPGLDMRVEDVVYNWSKRQFAKDVSNSGLGVFGNAAVSIILQIICQYYLLFLSLCRKAVPKRCPHPGGFCQQLASPISDQAQCRVRADECDTAHREPG